MGDGDTDDGGEERSGGRSWWWRWGPRVSGRVAAAASLTFKAETRSLSMPTAAPLVAGREAH